LVFYSSLPCGRAKQTVPALFFKILWDGCVIISQCMHNAVPGWLFLPQTLSWVYKSGLANIYQGLSADDLISVAASR
jgi:hypothetical protein